MTAGTATRLHRSLPAYAFLAPWIVGMLGITLGPMLMSLYYSFTDYALLGDPRWAGWDNYARLLSDERFLSSPTNLTVPLALRSFLDASGQSEWGQMFAMSVVTLVPVVVVFVIFQRKIVAGMAHTGMK